MDDTEKLKRIRALMDKWYTDAEELKRQYYFPDYNHWVDDTLRFKYNAFVEHANALYEILRQR